ncbi:MAG: hypothetical protein Q8P41_05240 [Pseudomonadota bacterium]|nr:hypothetical protein [Pseudomonadota bacterium]
MQLTLLLALLGCTGPAPGGAADRLAFRDLDCARIVDGALRDECVVYAVRAAPETADAACATVVSDVMREECWFTAVDARELTGDDAMRACGRTGRFVAPCHANAISREVSRLPPMNEAALTTEVQRILAVYHRPPREVGEIVRRRIAAVGEGASEGLGVEPAGFEPAGVESAGVEPAGAEPRAVAPD